MAGLPKNVPLFRREAVLHRTDAIFGGILLPQPKWQAYLVQSIIVLVGALVVLVLLGGYTKRSHASGWISLSPGPAAISSPSAGVLSNILVAEGQAVERGQLLFEISRARSSSTLPSVELEILRRLEDEKQNVVAQIGIEEALSRQARANTERELASLRVNALHGQQTSDLAREKLNLAEAEHRRIDQLVAKKWLPQRTLDESRAALLAAQITLQESVQRVHEHEDRLRAKEALLAALPLQLKQRLSDLESKLATLDRQRTEVQSATSVAIHAPISGSVTGVTLSVGDSVGSGSHLVSIVPERSSFQAELLVPSRDAGFLRKGMEVWIRYDAFPFQRFGQYRGSIRSVDLTILTPDRQTGPIRLNEPAYRVVVDLEQQRIAAYGREVPLQSGLTFTAAISQERQRLVDLVLDPVKAAGHGVY